MRFETYRLFERSGEELVSASTIAFRSREEITDCLTGAAFSVREVYGTWDRGPVE